jgi:CDP-paratose 2-epimerase
VTSTALITGSSGLIGSEAVELLSARGWSVHGIDNNMRKHFFGDIGDTSANLARLKAVASSFVHHDIDIRDRSNVDALVAHIRPQMVFHCAAQPSHDLAARIPFDDFETNAVGTLNLLESVRRHCAESPFIFMSTNKVYGDAPNEIPLDELDSRFDYADGRVGIDESMRVDQSTHSLFGASKLAADVLVQEYGRYFNMPTVCFRGGCLTGSKHAATELHGFLAYIARALRTNTPYRVYGYKGKQVRDNIHAADVCTAALAFFEAPRPGAVYNLGGGRANSVSMLEAIARLEAATNMRLNWSYLDEPRVGDHKCYVSDLSKFRADYPDWRLSVSIDAIIEDLARAGSDKPAARA